MRKVGYFFFAFLPVLIALGIQFIFSFFMFGGTMLLVEIQDGGISSLTDRIIKLSLSMSNPDFSYLVMIFYSVAVIFFFGIWYYCRYGGEFIPKKKGTMNVAMIFSLLLIVPGAQFFTNYVVSFIDYVKPEWTQQYERLFSMAGFSKVSFLLFLYAVIFGPICEELIFRGITLRCFEKAVPFWFANVFQALIFGAFHMNWVQGCYAFLLGILLGLVCELGGSIHYSIILHILFNFWGSVLSGMLPSDESFYFSIGIILLTVVSLVGGLALFFFARHLRDKKQNNISQFS